MDIICHFIFCRSTLQSGINIGPTFINFGFYSRPYSLIKGPTFIRFWNFYQGLQKFSSLMGFLLHRFAHFVHTLHLFKALCLFFLTNFPGPTVIPCPTSIPDFRVEEMSSVLVLLIIAQWCDKVRPCSIMYSVSSVTNKQRYEKTTIKRRILLQYICTWDT